MKKSNELKFVAFVFLTILISACAPAAVVPTNTAPPPTFTIPPPTFTPSPIPPTSTAKPPPTSDASKLNIDWLATTEEINSFSEDIGIVQWKVIQEQPGKNSECRYFSGQSWSASPNLAFNCIYKIAPNSSFDNVIDSLFKNGILYPDEVPIESSLSFEGDFALYIGVLSNGQSAYDLLVSDGSLLYWGSVSVGTPVGESPKSLYESNQKVIDEFLKNIVVISITRSKSYRLE